MKPKPVCARLQILTEAPHTNVAQASFEMLRNFIQIMLLIFCC